MVVGGWDWLIGSGEGLNQSERLARTDQPQRTKPIHTHTHIARPSNALLAEREAAELEARERAGAVGVQRGLHRVADVLAQHCIVGVGVWFLEIGLCLWG